MPVHDYVISNATGATIRADLNNALSAIVTNNSSNSEPATKYAYMWWADTSAGLLKIRNSSNDGWVTLFQLDGTLTLEDGSNSAPAIGFRDDDNTGIFSSAADNLDITTGGTTRVNVSSTGINVTGTVTDDGASHDGDVTFIGASANINFDKSDNALEFADNAKAVFGSDSDLQILHNGSDSFVRDLGTGGLYLTGSVVGIKNSGANENGLLFTEDGGVQIYYDNSNVLETINGGARVNGVLHVTSHLDMGDSDIIKLGDGDDLQIYHDGTDSYIQNETNDLFIDNNGDDIVIRTVDTIFFQVNNTENTITAKANDAVELYFDNVKKAHTSSQGMRVVNTGANAEFRVLAPSGYDAVIDFTSDNGAEHNDNYRLLVDQSTQNFHIQGKPSGTYTSFLKVNQSGNIQIPSDSTKLQLGASQDLELYHDGSNSYLKDAGTGVLRLTSNQVQVTNAAASEVLANFIEDGAVELFYDNSKKFETTSEGGTLTGRLTISDTSPIINFTDTNNDSDFRIQVESGSFIIEDATNSFADRFLINSTGNVQIPADNARIQIGASQDLEFYHDATNSVIANTTGSTYIKGLGTSGNTIILEPKNNENSAKFIPDGAVELYYDNSKKFETLTDGVNVTGTLKVNGSAISTGGLGNVVEDTTPQLGGDLQSNGNDIDFADNDKAIFGTGGDLEIFHDSNDSFIKDVGAGGLVLCGQQFLVRNAAADEIQIQALENGAVELYHDNTKRLETTSFGATVQGGITFGSDTAAANQIDDYEEGVFTPSLEFGGATTGITYSSMRGGSYTKIGRQVTVNFGFTLSSKGSASGDATIAGLPFAVEDLLSSTSAEASGVSCFWNDIATNSANIVFVALGGTSELEIRNTTGAEDDTDTMVDSDFENNTAIRGSITYFTAT